MTCYIFITITIYNNPGHDDKLTMVIITDMYRIVRSCLLAVFMHAQSTDTNTANCVYVSRPIKKRLMPMNAHAQGMLKFVSMPKCFS